MVMQKVSAFLFFYWFILVRFLQSFQVRKDCYGINCVIPAYEET